MLAFSTAGKSKILKVGVYGASGEGKTWLGCTSPKPLILLFEPQGFATVRLFAKERGIPIPPTVLIRNAHEWDLVVRTLAKEKERPIARLYHELNKLRTDEPELFLDEASLKEAISSIPYERPEWVVIDSLTELAWAIEKRIEEEAPPERGSDGLPAKTLRHSNALRDRFILAVKRIRDIHYNTLLLALRDDREKGKDSERTVEVAPSLPMRKMPQDLVSTLNALGLLRRERVVVSKKEGEDGDDETEVRRVVRFSPLPSYVTGKPYGDLGVEEPDVSTWIQKLEAANEPAANEPAAKAKTKKEK